MVSRVVNEPTYSQKARTFILNVIENMVRLSREAAKEVVESHCSICSSQVESPSRNSRLRTLLRNGDFRELRMKGRGDSGLLAIGHHTWATMSSVNEGNDASV